MNVFLDPLLYVRPHFPTLPREAGARPGCSGAASASVVPPPLCSSSSSSFSAFSFSASLLRTSCSRSLPGTRCGWNSSRTTLDTMVSTTTRIQLHCRKLKKNIWNEGKPSIYYRITKGNWTDVFLFAENHSLCPSELFPQNKLFSFWCIFCFQFMKFLKYHESMTTSFFVSHSVIHGNLWNLILYNVVTRLIELPFSLWQFPVSTAAN